jgi:hypothetical protein
MHMPCHKPCGKPGAGSSVSELAEMSKSHQTGLGPARSGGDPVGVTGPRAITADMTQKLTIKARR